MPTLQGPIAEGRINETEVERKKKAKQPARSPAPTPRGPHTLIHVLIQLDLQGSGRLLQPGVVQTSLEVPVLSFLDLASYMDSLLGEGTESAADEGSSLWEAKSRLRVFLIVFRGVGPDGNAEAAVTRECAHTT